jgi:hypothetical protein
MMSRKRTTLAAVFPGLLVCVGVWFADSSCDSRQTADRIQNAVWATTPAGPRLVLHEQIDRSSDNGSWTVERIVLIDPLTGVPTEPWFAHFDGEERAVLHNARGGFLWFQVGFGSLSPFFLVPATGGKSVPLSALPSQYPAVTAPWYSATVGGDGLIYVEADDRTSWHIDVGTHTASLDAKAPVGWHPAMQWEGLGFIDAPTQRHSDLAHYALSQVDEYGGAVGAPIAAGFTNPRFLGEGVIHVGERALIADGASVVTIDRVGARGWSWAVPEGKVEQWAAWPVDGGALVRTDRRFTLLAPNGEVRWTLVR